MTTKEQDGPKTPPAVDTLDGANQPSHWTPPPVPNHQSFDPRVVFEKHFEPIRQLLSKHDQSGFLVCAVDKENLWSIWVAASHSDIRAAILGRHSRATLKLPETHACIALRHLALLVSALPGGRPTARVLDLQTGVGFGDHTGRSWEAVQTSEMTYLAIGTLILMLIPTGQTTDLPTTFDEFWASTGVPNWPSKVSCDVDADSLQLHAYPGPQGVGQNLCLPGEVPLGLATISAEGDESILHVSGRALDEGFIVGRYDRSEVGGTDTDEGLSRVHLLVVRDRGKVLAIDTASTNGTYVGEDRIHLLDLGNGSHIDLGGVLHFTWHVSN